METAPLKSFATWARTALIREVNASIAAALAPASSARVEHPELVAALEKAVAAAGGEGDGSAAVADQVAYTWFNRIIALRFMDANGYTGAGVVSPRAGSAVGQPEILADAKRGVFDVEVVGESLRDEIAALLNASRASGDAQSEAYALLLAAYCRHWNRSMPFMFEREGDYTELLIPANLLADGSALDRAVRVLTTDVCKDVEVIGWLYQFYIAERKDEVFAGFKKSEKAGAAEIPAATQLFTPHWIVRYLVENSVGRLWMLNRPSSSLVDQMEYYVAPIDDEIDFLTITKPEELTVIDPACGSGHMLTYAFDLLYAIYEEEGYAPSDIPSLILAKNLFGTEIDRRAGALAAFALTMKARAKKRTFFSDHVEPNVCVVEPIALQSNELDLLVTDEGGPEEVAFWNQFGKAATFGSLIQSDAELTARLGDLLGALDGASDMLNAAAIRAARRIVHQARYLSSSFSVTIANPPYMGSRNMSQDLRDFAEAEYPKSKADLYSMFMEKALIQTDSGGYVAMVTMQNWMFLASHATLRNDLLTTATIVSMAHLGSRAFSTISGEVVATTAFVLRNARSHQAGAYFRLTDLGTEEKPRALARAAVGEDTGRRYLARSQDFALIPDSPIAYDFAEDVRALYRANRSLGERIALKQGMATTDNARFVRYWYEVSLGTICFGSASTAEVHARGGSWVPYNKGGTPTRWYGNQDCVVRWKDRASELATVRPRSVLENRYFFQPSISWSNIGTSGAKFRFYPRGFVFDVAGMSAFPQKDTDRLYLLGYLNSSTAGRLLQTLAPTVNYQIGDIAKLPFVESRSTEVLSFVRELIELRSEGWRLKETSWDFDRVGIPFAPSRLVDAFAAAQDSVADIEARIHALERRNDTAWEEALGVPAGEKQAGPSNQQSAEIPGRTELATDLVSYAVGCMLGRYSIDEPGLILADQGATLADYLSKVPSPGFLPDADNVLPIVDGDWFEDDIVSRFRQFLRTAFGDEHFEENLKFVEASLGVKNMRAYFVRSFYKDHVQRYKKRPIYWLFSSSKGSFNALIYMHRYTSSTVSTVLNEYLREYQAKLASSLEHHERLAAGSEAPRERATAQKETERLRSVLLELREYEHDILYPLATQQIDIDLDDGVKVNYPKFGGALKRIPGLEASDA